MNPIYKFELTAGNTTQRAYPIYKDSLALEFEKESGQEFFRAKLSGDLTFERDDYDFIVAQAFDEQFLLEIFISRNAGQSWTSYWKGTFWKTDCKFDGDAETVVVKPTVNDRYNDILAGLDKEYNLIELAPDMAQIHADKRPMVQVYVPGASVVGCFLSGMWWEQECEPESDESKLQNDFHFWLNKSLRVVDATQTGLPAIPSIFTGEVWSGTGTQDFTNGDYKFEHLYYASSGGSQESFRIIRVSDSQIMWKLDFTNQPGKTFPIELTLQPESESGATGTVTISIHDINVYSRFVCDTEQVAGNNTFPIPDDDIVENNRNYTRVIGYDFPDTIYFSTGLTETPNQWGLYQPGKYYQPPYLYWDPELFPVARNCWTQVSIWYTFSALDWLVEESGRQEFTIRHAYPIWSVLQKLLEKVAPDIDFRANYTCSQFLYPYYSNPISGLDFGLFITPKSNIVSAGYDQPAQKAPITLRAVFDMLRDCFRCYWFVDDNDHLHIEHIQYFRNGGSYSGSPVVGIDLTRQTVSRSGKPWAFGKDQYEYDKPAMAARYQFGWMDDVTQLFAGYPIDILSKYVNPENIEQITVNQFSSDIDYILLNPGDISKDGFVLLAAINSPGKDIEQINPDSYTKRSRWISTSTGLWGSSTTYKHILIPVTPGQRIKVTAKSNNTAQLAWLTSDAAATSGGTPSYVPGTTVIQQTAGTTQYYNVPNGALYMYVYLGAGDSYPYTPEYIGLTGQPGYYLPYVNYVVDNNDHYLQNAYVAFCLLQQYYAYDMPAPSYEINGVQMQATGVKRLKGQTVKFPLLNDPDLVELIKTNLGNGTIEKLSLNLSSRNATASLKYDTE